MRLPKAYSARGFSLIELLVVLALVGIAVSAGAVVAMASLERGSVDSERDMLVSLLTEARVKALTNENGVSHGVHIAEDSFVLFEGDSFAASTEASRLRIERTAHMSAPEDIVFLPISGNATETVLTLTMGSISRTVAVSPFGRIEW